MRKIFLDVSQCITEKDYKEVEKHANLLISQLKENDDVFDICSYYERNDLVVEWGECSYTKIGLF